jgi:hypothetical protein
VTGSGLVEALVSLVLVSLAASAIAAAAAASGRTLVHVRDDAIAVALASGRLDALRAGPRADGTLTNAPFTSDWRVSDGRGHPDSCDVTITWPGHRFDLASAVLP